jgi:hypothetical protein
MSNYPLPAIMGGRSGNWEKCDDFHLFPLKLCISFYIYKKISGSSPNYFLSHHTTFSQTRTGATVPLRTLYYFFWSWKKRLKVFGDTM